MRKKPSDNIVNGKKVKKLREKKGLSRTHLADKIGVAYAVIWKIENFGSDTYVSNLQKISEELRVTVTELLIPDVVSIG